MTPILKEEASKTLEVMDFILQRLTSCQYEQIVHLSILHTEVTLTNLWELKQYR